MKVHRFIGAFDLGRRTQVLIDDTLVHQLVHVLRLRVGEHIILCDGRGNEAEAAITGLDRRSVGVLLAEPRPVQAEPVRQVTLVVAILKRENMEWVVQKATEVGVHAILPVITKRTIKTGVNTERLQVIAKEAAEQSGRGRVPVIQEPMHFPEALSQVIGSSETVWMCDGSGGDLAPGKTTHTAIAVCVGPEGGWDPAEIALARSQRAQVVRLGNTVLRGETAAVIATYLATNT